MNRPLLMIAFMVASFAVAACAPTQTYDVHVRNNSTRPVTLWLTKTGPPIERGWLAPEHWAIERPGREEPVGGVIIDPGQVASTGRVRGTFPHGTEAVLRVYAGERTMSELLAISRDSHNRTDIILDAGVNELVVLEREGQMVVEQDRRGGAARPRGAAGAN